ncbi:MAG TPA: hypothetical protein VNQ74_16010 [Burkholderiaceae bacterium]|nr:hypothetical protein [Burkholderiaceae bacterium]
MAVRQAILYLLLLALALPIIFIVLLGISRLLDAMADPVGALAIGRIALAAAIVWVIDLVLLVVAQALSSLLDRPE